MKFDLFQTARELSFLNYTFVIGQTEKGDWYLQGQYLEPDIVTGEQAMQFTRKWLLSQHMTKSEFVQTAFKLCITSMEHRTREAFQYRGRRIFGPHFNVDQLWELCGGKCLDVRPSIKE